eukprot:scaffold17291_cov127-Isochrysis_galbana.AAC.6
MPVTTVTVLSRCCGTAVPRLAATRSSMVGSELQGSEIDGREVVSWLTPSTSPYLSALHGGSDERSTRIPCGPSAASVGSGAAAADNAKLRCGSTGDDGGAAGADERAAVAPIWSHAAGGHVQ